MKTVVVLGCFRSATSLIAKGLHLAGVHMGDNLVPAGPGNPWGHWEDIDFVNLNDQILGAAGGQWDIPPEPGEIEKVAEAFSGKVSELLASKQRRAEESGYVAWGWKDPRTVLTFPVYRPYLTDPVLVIVRRDFTDIVSSLCRRDHLHPVNVKPLTTIYLDRLSRIAQENGY